MSVKKIILCFELRDDGEDGDVIATRINKELFGLGIPPEAVISIMQPSGSAITRVFYIKQL